MKNDSVVCKINACYMPLAFLYGLCRVRVSIGEQRFTQAWGEQDYQLSSGMHRVAVHFRYCFLPMGNASVDIQVEGVSRGHPPTVEGVGKSRTPTDHELPRDFPGDAFAMATLASIGASEQKAARHGDTTRTHRR